MHHGEKSQLCVERPKVLSLSPIPSVMPHLRSLSSVVQLSEPRVGRAVTQGLKRW